MQTAPERLEPMQDLTVDDLTRALIAERRLRVVNAIHSPNQFLVFLGPCALSDHRSIIEDDGAIIMDFEEKNEGITTLYRLPPHKPRSQQDSWKGLETTDPDLTTDILLSMAALYGNLAIEVVLKKHINRYKDISTVAWFGARSIDDIELLDAVALEMPSILLPIKNGTDGRIDKAMSNVERANKLRADEDAPAILVYRGGENAKTPDAWEQHYIDAHERTNGQLLVDLAHGSEMAHDKDFTKSVEGQVMALNHLTQIVLKGYAPRGVMIEASNAPRTVDPNMPLDLALQGTQNLLDAVVTKSI